MDASHIFPQGVLAAINLVKLGLEMEGLELDLGVKQGFPSAQWPSPPYQEQDLIPSCYDRSPEIHLKLDLFPLSVCFPLSQHHDPCPRGGEY